MVRAWHWRGCVASQVDLVALSLLWTEGAERKPEKRLSAPDPADSDVARPDPRTLLDLDEVLARLELTEPAAKAAELRRRAEAALEAGRRRNLAVIGRDSAAYPFRLASIPDPPPVLWSRGTPGPCRYSVAVVGSRSATPHALEVGARLGLGLAGAGFDVVSGLARGVDAAAHRGALRGAGRTVAVLGSGVDVIYPPEHARLADEIAERGAVVSEFAPGVPPRGWHFPRRNRIISGLALGVVVIEASHRSGSLITARCALEQGRSVMAVPGAVLSGRNRGGHALLRDGAGIVEEASHVVDQLRADWPREFDPTPERPSGPEPPSGPGPLLMYGPAGDAGEPGSGSGAPSAAPPGDPVLRVMQPGESYPLEDLAEQTGLSPMELLTRLTRLEMSGWVARLGPGRFVKAGANVLR